MKIMRCEPVNAGVEKVTLGDIEELGQFVLLRVGGRIASIAERVREIEHLCCAGCICSYSFCYVDKIASTAFIESVSTREKYRHKGLGSAMMLGIISKWKEISVEKCYANSYDWCRKFYNMVGFQTEDSISFGIRV